MPSDSGIRARHSVPASQKNPDGLDVLVVDDDPRWREYTADPFLRRGDRVRTTADGLEALSLCVNDPPDIVLTDVNMPRMDGWQLLRMIRSRPNLTGVPVVFLTTLDGDEERLKGYQLGVDAYIAKPFHPDELLMRVHRVVRRRRQKVPEDVAATFSGDLEHVGPASLLSFLSVERKTGVLLIVAEQVARVFLREGRALRVEIEGDTQVRTARDTLMSLLDWESGQFEFNSEPVTGNDEVRTAIAAVVLEHARMSDERRR
jgi:DNA-binding response OmpR family regulator